MNSEFEPLKPAFASHHSLASDQPVRWLRDLLTALLKFLTGEQSLSIRTQKSDKGTQWIAYDALQNVRYVFTTEQALRIWLEQRHRL